MKFLFLYMKILVICAGFGASYYFGYINLVPAIHPAFVFFGSVLIATLCAYGMDLEEYGR